MDAKTLEQHGLTDAEYQRIVASIGREPNLPELGIFSVMWSEHCSYKSSKIYLKQFPTKSPRVLQGPGENAGILDVGHGWAVAFKMESHNHPSFIEPTQGAATGVGGILRDIFTMGARPIASLDSLRFGDPKHPKTAHLLRGVVSGIGGYGNCMGVPTVGGETRFDACYNGNILVNAMTVGLVRHDKIYRGRATGVGNKVILVGSKTGRDGIHGATMASDVFDESSESKRPTVQVGDPFTEKKLLEACMEVFETDAVLGIQDMGAAGFTCSTFEMSARGGVGMKIDLDKIPLRETGMTPYEILLSESQERMLLVAAPGKEETVLKIFKKWELEAAIVGTVIAEPKVIATFAGKIVVDLPTAPVVDEAPVYERPVKERAIVRSYDRPLVTARAHESTNAREYENILERLITSPNLASKRWVWRQYDQSVMVNTVEGPGGDAAVLRLKEMDEKLAVTVDGKGKLCALNPYWGAVHTLAEAARNLACVGAEPLGITDCLNFGSPENPEVMWEFKEVCRGLSDACRAFELPVTGGNVSFYNETDGKAIDPTPTVGMVGLIPAGTPVVRSCWKQSGDAIYLLGPDVEKTVEEILPLDYDLEKNVQKVCRDAIQQGLVHSAHDVSEGGALLTLAECCFGAVGLGACVEIQDVWSEAPSRIVVSLAPEKQSAFEKMALQAGVPCRKIGTVGGSRLQINQTIDGEVEKMKALWNSALENHILCAE